MSKFNESVRNKRKEGYPKNSLQLKDQIFKDVYELTEKRVKNNE